MKGNIMGAGRVRITNYLIADALRFPKNWEIKWIKPLDITNGVSEMLIVGPDFPSVNNRGDAEDVELIIHEEARTFEVKKR